jgi:hypothetical protein
MTSGIGSRKEEFGKRSGLRMSILLN